jgi:hypothetical protein
VFPSSFTFWSFFCDEKNLGKLYCNRFALSKLREALFAYNAYNKICAQIQPPLRSLLREQLIRSAPRKTLPHFIVRPARLLTTWTRAFHFSTEGRSSRRSTPESTRSIRQWYERSTSAAVGRYPRGSCR